MSSLALVSTLFPTTEVPSSLDSYHSTQALADASKLAPTQLHAAAASTTAPGPLLNLHAMPLLRTLTSATAKTLHISSRMSDK